MTTLKTKIPTQTSAICYLSFLHHNTHEEASYAYFVKSCNFKNFVQMTNLKYIRKIDFFLNTCWKTEQNTKLQQTKKPNYKENQETQLEN